MGFIADNVELSQYALGVAPFAESIPPSILGPKDLPYLAPPFTPLADKSQAMVDQLQSRSRTAAQEQSAAAGHLAAMKESSAAARIQARSPEQNRGAVIDAAA